MRQQWRSSMDAAFINVMQSMQTPGDYWKQGCAFDTIVDYLKYTINAASHEAKQQAIQNAQTTISDIYYKVYLQNRLNGAWYDDWAWWGIASTKSYDPAYSDVFGGLAKQFQDEAIFCYETMVSGRGRNEKFGGDNYHGAANVWATCDQLYYKKVEPLFPGGSWQDDFPKPEAWPVGPLDPSNTLEYYQVSVMNGLFLVFSSQIAMQFAQYANDAKKQHDFIQNWYAHKPGTEENSMQTFDSGALVRERVGYYKSGQKVNSYYPDTSWGGDQGLFIGGVLAYSRYHPAEDVKKFISDVVTGVSLHMLDTSLGGHVMAPYTGSFLSDIDPGDYASGVGVFMRYLLLANTKSSDLIQALVKNPNSGLEKMLTDSANYYAQQPTPDPIVSTPTIFKYFNQLSVLLAATEILD